jgi:capsular polysaccharide biosynthesis protein
VTLDRITGSGPRVRSWTDNESVVAGESRGAGPGGGLASLSFIGEALRRRAWLWCLMAVAGLLAALAFKAVFPPAYQASTSILMVYTADQNPAEAIQTDIALAQSRPVAVDAMRKLGMPVTPQAYHSFLAAYTVGQITDRVIGITVSAPSSREAVARARVLATDFLQFRTRELQTQQQLAIASLNHQITLDKRELATITKEIAAISPAAASSTQPNVAVGSLSRAERARLATLRTKRTQAQATLTGMEQAAQGYPVGTASMIHGSEVLDAAAPVHRSVLRLTLLYAWGGLVAGLTLGLGIVIVQALVSGRLRRRDDIARALGAPIHLSVGRLQAQRWRRSRRGARDRDVQRLVAHLRSAVPARAGGAGALAVVAVDNAREVAPSVVALAVSYAQEGKQVVLADLADGAPAARLLGIIKPGTGAARVHGVPLMVTLPGRDTAAPTGPLPQAGPAVASEVPPDVYFSADVLLSLVTLDPALGADYLPTWASGAVVLVTADRSSWARIHAVGEMIRLARTPLVSTVLVGADKTDESVGMAAAPVNGRSPARAGSSR